MTTVLDISEDGSVRTELLLRAAELTLGTFHVEAGSDFWHQETFIRRGPLIAMARRPVEIEHADEEPIVADATRAILHNHGNVYRRRRLDERGEYTIWIGVGESALASVFHGALDDPERPFSTHWADVCERAQLACCSLVQAIRRGDVVDPIESEETLVHIVSDILSHRGQERGVRASRRRSTAMAHRESAHAMNRFIARHYREPITLADVARAGYLSAFHGARIYREQTGRTIHQHVRALRLGEAMDRIADRGQTLAEIAVDVGFASHAHFTDSFRKVFGVAPSQVRDDPARYAHLVDPHPGTDA